MLKIGTRRVVSAEGCQPMLATVICRHDPPRPTECSASIVQREQGTSGPPNIWAGHCSKPPQPQQVLKPPDSSFQHEDLVVTSLSCNGTAARRGALKPRRGHYLVLEYLARYRSTRPDSAPLRQSLASLTYKQPLVMHYHSNSCIK